MQLTNYLALLTVAFGAVALTKPIPDSAVNEVAQLVARGVWNNGSPTCDKPEELTQAEWDAMTK